MIELVIVSRLLEYRMLPYGSINKRCLRRLPRRKSAKRGCPCAGHFPARFNDDDPLDAQAQYSELFDRGRATSCCYLNMFTVNPVTAARRWWTAGAVRAARLAVKQPRIARPLPLYLEYLAQLPQSEAVEGLKILRRFWHC